MAESIETTTRHSSHHVSGKGKQGERYPKTKTKILTCVIVIYRVSPDRRKTHPRSFKQQLQLSRNPQEPPPWLYSGQHTAVICISNHHGNQRQEGARTYRILPTLNNMSKQPHRYQPGSDATNRQLWDESRPPT